MSVHRIRPEVTAKTKCPNAHEDTIEAINPVLEGGELVQASWPSAIDFCMECEQPVMVLKVQVQR